MDKKSLSSAFLAAILICGLVLASALCFGTVQAYTVDSISKPSVPEFSVRVVAYPYDVPPKTTTTIDEYTGKETTTTQPGYRVENKSIEIIIENPQFTPVIITEYTPIRHYWHEDSFPTHVECNYTTNLYYNIEVKGNFGNDWKSVGSISSYPEGPQSNAQLDSEYTVIAIEADVYPKDAVLDFRIQTLIGYYLPYGRNIITFGYDFYGKESDWSDTQTIKISESQTLTPAPTPTLPNDGPTAPPTQEPALTQEQVTTIAGTAIVVAVIGAALGLLVYLIKRK